MARYIDAEQFRGKHEVAEINGKLYSVIPYADIVYAPTADVVPKSEVDEWYHEYHAIKDALKQEKMYHRETEKLADKYCVELQTAKAEVAMEIFEEIDNLFDKYPTLRNIGGAAIAELKKKYTEGEGICQEK